MKQNKVKPNLITYTNLVQACLKAKHLDYLGAVLSDLDKDNIKGKFRLIENSKIFSIVDQVFYTKLILGIQSLGNCGLLCFYLKKSFNDKVFIGQDLYDNSIKMLEFYDGPEKTEIIQKIQSIKNGERENNNAGSESFGRNQKKSNSNFKKYYDDKENQNQENNNWKNQSHYQKPYSHQKNSFAKEANQPTTGMTSKNGFYNNKPRQNFYSQENKENQGGVFSNALKNRYR